MAPTVQKITLSSSRDIPFNKLVLSQSNVRRVKAGVSIEELAEDIARRTLLQGLNVRPVLDAHGVETGMFEVPAGGRRYRALQLLVKQKRLAKTAPVPCVVRDPSVDISADDRSCASGAGLGNPSALVQPGAVSDPPHADGARRARIGPARPVRRPRCL
jgi:ParB family chromosome partitioning protein